MKVKNLILNLAFIIIFVFSLCALGFGVTSLAVHAEEVTPSEEVTTPEDAAAEEVNNGIERWVGVILGAISTIFSCGTLGAIALKKKQTVAVTVNDAQTQEKLNALEAENAKLQEILVAMLKLEKGTQDVLKALFAENPNIDDKIHNIINTVALNSEAIIKDVDDILSKETHTKLKSVLDSVSNVVLG